MGAVPGGRFLSTLGGPPGWFDVERFRTAPRTAELRAVDGPVLVLGSTQPAAAFAADRAARAGVAVVRRRSGGGAVLVGPGDPLWVDLWVPRDDPLWVADVVRAAQWAGEWWAAALRRAGAGDLAVHRGASVPAPWSDAACFAGVGPGEVLAGRRKVVGVAQWRCREGALFHTCAYRRWDPRPLAALLDLPAPAAEAALADLSRVAVGLDELVGTGFEVAGLLAALPPGPGWVVRTPPADAG